MRAANTIYSPHRAVAPKPDTGPTISEIEMELLEIRPETSDLALREMGLLFVILRVGYSIEKLAQFTNYPREFLRDRVEGLRGRGLLFTGNLSTQWLLDQVPGSEGLIERITGQRFPRKESPRMANPEAEPKQDPVKTDKRKTKRGRPPRRKANGAAPTVEAEGVKFTIYYQDEETIFERKGDSLPKFLSAMSLLDGILNPTE